MVANVASDKGRKEPAQLWKFTARGLLPPLSRSPLLPEEGLKSPIVMLLKRNCFHFLQGLTDQSYLGEFLFAKAVLSFASPVQGEVAFSQENDGRVVSVH